MRKLWFFAALVVALPVAAQFHTAPVPNSPECALGLKYDSGLVGGTVNSPNPDWIGVMRFDLPQGTTALRQICVRIQRLNTQVTSVPYQIMVFDDNGPQGQPGTVLTSMSASA